MSLRVSTLFAEHGDPMKYAFIISTAMDNVLQKELLARKDVDNIGTTIGTFERAWLLVASTFELAWPLWPHGLLQTKFRLATGFSRPH